MTKTKINAIVSGRLLIAGVLLIIRWLLFEPLYFFGVIISTIGESALNGINGTLAGYQEANNELLNKQK